MRFKGLCVVILLVVLASCSKKENITPVIKGTNGTAPATPVFSLASALQSNMVVQRDKQFVVWGGTNAGRQVAVNVSWNTGTFKTAADAKGNWSVTIPANGVNATPQTIMAKPDGGDAVILTNVLLGDVWLCSGQSNMVMPLDAIAPFTGVLNYQAEIAAANFPAIRSLNIASDYESSPITNLNNAAAWTLCSPANAGNLSAVAYYFARKLNTTLNVPVGIIVAAINGSYCQQWANIEAINNDPLIQPSYKTNVAVLYNGMINPLTNLSLKGFIWYQGENNQHDTPSDYTEVNSALIKGWRSKFNGPGLPFYFVQLTPFAEDYDTTTPPGGDTTLNYLAKFREGQANIRQLAGTGMAVTMDVGEQANHHPRNKKPVGERLALLALKNDYNQNVVSVGPRYLSFSATGSMVTVNFATNDSGPLTTAGNGSLKQFFFVAGTDHVFRQGVAAINGSTIKIVAPSATPLPVLAVRYAFTNAPVTNLQNTSGLPAEPFRTDDWNN